MWTSSIPDRSIEVTIIILIDPQIDHSLLLVSCTKTGPELYWVEFNGTHKNVETSQMANDTLLLNIDGASHHTYMHDEAEGYRIVIDNRTVIFEKENDPQILRATSPGKLIKYLVSDGDHVDREQVRIGIGSELYSWEIPHAKLFLTFNSLHYRTTVSLKS